MKTMTTHELPWADDEVTEVDAFARLTPAEVDALFSLGGRRAVAALAALGELDMDLDDGGAR